MGDPVGLARLPADVTAAVEACAEALAGCAVQLDVVLRSGDAAPLEELGARRAHCGREVARLLEAARASRRPGPDRSRLAELARSVDRTAEAVESVGWAWARHPVPGCAGVLRAARDGTRSLARAVTMIEDEGGRVVWDARCREREAEARFLARAARAELLAGHDDVRLAAAAHDVLTYASLWLAALGSARAAVLRFGLE
jgi:hypothetical protein